MTPYFLGFDLGSSYSKGTLVDHQSHILCEAVEETGVSFEGAADRIFTKICKTRGIEREQVTNVVATGVGRKNLSLAKSVKTEISCLAKGIFHYFSKDITAVDIGGQDTKIVKIHNNESEIEFKVNRKCAAGTGAFLEEISQKLKIPLSEMNALAEKAQKSVEIGSYCTVFAGTEIIHLLREGKDIHAILRGVYESIAQRVLSMDSLTRRYALVGGIPAHHPVIGELFEEKTGKEPLFPPNPQTTVAFGASLFAIEEAIPGG